MAEFNVNTPAQLSQAITTSANNGEADTINITGDITLTGLLPLIEEDVELRINSSLDFETRSSYSIRVQTTDSANNALEEVLTINVIDEALNSSPTDIVLSNSSINENSPLGAVVGTFSTTDPDVSDSFTYQLVSGNNAFTIVGDQLLTNSSLDFETQSSYRIFVQTTDLTGASYSEVLIINVNDEALNSSPTDLELSS